MSPYDELPVRRKKLTLKKPFQTEEELDTVQGPQIPSTAKKIGGDYNWYQPAPTGTTATASASKRPTTFDTKGALGVADAVTPYISNITNSIRRMPKPAVPRPVSAVSTNSPSFAGERVEIDRSVRGLNNSADLNLDANSAAAVKTANSIQGFRAKGESFMKENTLVVQNRNASAQINGSIEALNSSKMDQYNENILGMRIAKARESSENISNFSDKRIQEIARRDAMGLDTTKYNILSKMYTSGVLDRLVKKVNNDDTVSGEDLDRILHGDTKANGGNLVPVFDAKKVKGKVKKAIGDLPPEMAGQYRTDLGNGGYIGGSIMHTPKLRNKGRLRRII